MPQYVLTQLLWETGEETPFWHRQDALWWSDWRSIPNQGTPGPVPRGWILAGFPTGVVPPNSIDLGDSLDGLVPPGVRASVSSVLSLGERLPGDTLSRVFQNLLIRMGDPTSLTRWRGIRANGNRLQLRIGGVVILDEPFNEHHPAWNHTRDIFRAAYRHLRDQVNAGTLPLEAAQRYTGHEMRKYGVAAEALLPPEFVGDDHRPPRTTLGDTFVEGSDTAITSHTATGPNGGFAWTLFESSLNCTVRAATDDVGNDDATSNSDGRFRADSDLSSDEHYAQALFEFTSEADHESECIIRKDSTPTNTSYSVEYHMSGDRTRAEQTVSGTRTTLATSTATDLSTTPFTGYVQVDSSDVVEVRINETVVITHDDSASPVGAGNLRTGFRLHPPGSAAANVILLDDFEAADLAAAATAKRRRVGTGAGWSARR